MSLGHCYKTCNMSVGLCSATLITCLWSFDSVSSHQSLLEMPIQSAEIVGATCLLDNEVLR